MRIGTFAVRFCKNASEADVNELKMTVENHLFRQSKSKIETLLSK